MYYVYILLSEKDKKL